MGSRTPVAETPAWLTLEVVTGGFATGKLQAGGALLPFERALLKQMLIDAPSDNDEQIDRTALNNFFISQQGFEQLQQRLRDGEYEITVPEEGALLVVAWLADNGFPSGAQDLLEALLPFFSKVRFYPRPGVGSFQSFTGDVFLRDVKTVTRDLKHVRTPLSVLSQHEAITVWEPFREEVVGWLTQEARLGPLSLKMDLASEAGQLVEEYETLRSQEQRCRKPLRKDSLGQMISLMRVWHQTGTLSDSQIARLNTLRDRFYQRRGTIDSKQHQQFRDRQKQQIRTPISSEIAKVLVSRLSKQSQHEGVRDLEPLIREVDASEESLMVSAGTAIPDSMMRKLERCLYASTEELIRRKIIKSADTLAIVLPQVVGNLRAAGMGDATLRNLYAAIYRAFRKRRSLLLLNFENQVKLEELPWIKAIDSRRSHQLGDQEAAMEAARRIARITLESFPFAIVPNKLLQEFRAVAASAKLQMPLVDELAVDIFMGGFTDKFVHAAQDAAELFQGTLYETYYQIDFDEIKAIRVSGKVRKRFRGWATPIVNEAFGKICRRRAPQSGKGSWVAVNGTVIEQQQILTTQNVATLLKRLQLVTELREQYAELAAQCFRWVCTTLQIDDSIHHARLIKLKNSAYAWRQMICFLSLASHQEMLEFSRWAMSHLAEQSSDFQFRFKPAVEGLRDAIQASVSSRTLPASHQPFVGWSAGKHWFHD